MGWEEDRQMLPADHFRLRIYIPLLPYWMAQLADAAATAYDESCLALQFEQKPYLHMSLLVKK